MIGTETLGVYGIWKLKKNGMFGKNGENIGGMCMFNNVLGIHGTGGQSQVFGGKRRTESDDKKEEKDGEDEAAGSQQDAEMEGQSTFDGEDRGGDGGEVPAKV